MSHRTEANKRRIVKVQISLATTELRKQALIYDKYRDWRWQGDASSELLTLVDGRPKAFFAAYLRRDGRISIEDEVAEEAW